MQTTTVGTERVTACPVCASRRLRRWSSAHDRLHRLVDQDFEYSKCRDCHLVLLTVRPVEAGAAALYPDDYGPYTDGQDGEAVTAPPLGPVLGALSRAQARWPLVLVDRAVARVSPDRLPGELAHLYTPPSPSAAMVDYGCGRPAFLDRARGDGWAVTIGVDFTPSVLARVAAAGHRAVAAADVGTAVDDESVDVIRLNHVFEHVYHPLELLELLHRKLLPGGTLHLAIPNGRSWWASVFRRRWFNADPRHLVFYGPDHIRRLAENCGFGEVRILHEVVTRDIVRSWGYVLEDRGRLRHPQVQALALDPDRQRLVLVPARLAAAFGAGDRFHALLTR